MSTILIPIHAVSQRFFVAYSSGAFTKVFLNVGSAVVLSTLAAYSLTETKVETQNICAFSSMPLMMTFTMGALDGARFYVTVCMLWLLLLVSSVTIEATMFLSLFACKASDFFVLWVLL
ncbi:hypothetical protein F5146DRAFT_1003384 [Armillaria mellea]|nr:hypothetical protein F5146DRAFT_1003384 [Armillaria mellea]